MSVGKAHVEDAHFYLDNAHPSEVLAVLRVLSSSEALTAADIVSRVVSLGLEMQRDRTYTPRRLFDLGLSERVLQNGLAAYRLTCSGVVLQSLAEADGPLVTDLLHYLHYTGSCREGPYRKYLWSYRRCCEHMWNTGLVPTNSKMAAIIQADMIEKYPGLDVSARVGARFDATAVGRVKTWLRALEPCPFSSDSRSLVHREVRRMELALLAIDDVYRSHGYVYGDPVLMDDAFLNEVGKVFFLDMSCCLHSISIALRLTSFLQSTDTLAGPAITLLRPVGIEDLR
jgi:hypothetical protein